MNYKDRKDTHDYFTPEHVQVFLRNHRTGLDNQGRQYLGHIVKLYGTGPEVKFLDIACCTGTTFETIKLMGLNISYTGIDRTKQFLAHARNLYKDYQPRPEFLEGYAQELPFKDGEFDLVCIRHLLEHLPDGYEAAIKEAVRVASKEAIIVFFLEPHSGSEDIIKEEGPDERGCTYYWNNYSRSKLLKFLSQFGCQIKVERVETPGAAHADLIIRLIK